MRIVNLKAGLLVFIAFSAFAQPAVLREGKWLKMGIEQDGLYQVDYNLMSKLGSPTKLDPKTIKIFAFETGMLPQPNSTSRQKGLREVAIQLQGMEDGRFDRGDKIIFYGQGPDVIEYIKSEAAFRIENNLYDDVNYYFLTFGGTQGKRISSTTTPVGTTNQVTTHQDFFYSEVDRVNILKSGREWFGLDFDANTEATINFEMDDMVAGSDVKLITRLMAESYQNAGFNIQFNGQSVAQYPIASIPQTSYGIKGRTRNDTAIFRFNGISGKQAIKLIYDRGGNNYSIGRLDYLIAILKRTLSYNGKPKIFFTTDAAAGLNEFVINASASATVLDVTDPFNITELPATYQNNKIRFVSDGTQIKSYMLFQVNSALLQPIGTTTILNQELTALPASKLLIVTHPEFLDQAKRLAEHRINLNEISTVVVTTEQIYNEYSGGRMDPTAIRDFVREQYHIHNRTLKYLLLFGKGTYDYRNLTTKKSTLVPIYQSYNSLSPLETYASDDYFGFLEDSEGSWNENPAEFHTLDIGVGRIPCVSTEQAEDLVDKIISYDINPEANGLWRRLITFVADDGDANIHQSQANQLAGIVEQKRPDLLANRLFLDLFEQEDKSFGQISLKAADALFRKFHEGSIIINFTGHGSEQLWMAERMLDPDRIGKLNNRFRLPFLITATCEFGRNDDPALQSAAEQILLKKASGAIGLVTSSRPVSSATNFELNSDLYNALFNGTSFDTPLLGTMFMRTKNARDTRVGNRNFILLGDPSMQLALPKIEINVNEIISQTGNQNIGGLEEVSIAGEVIHNGTLVSGYQGTVSLELYDRPVSVSTLGDENEPFGFDEWQQVLFRGQAEVKNGRFNFQFVTPSSNRTSSSTGKLLLHASSSNQMGDAGGAEFPINLIPSNFSVNDQVPPLIQLWMNDTTFVSGKTTGKDPILIARFFDSSGIDVSMGADSRLVITLDDQQTFFVENYYSALNGNGLKGLLAFQFFDLTEGPHQATLTAYDLNGNSTNQTILFTVDGSKLEVNIVNGFPNPFNETTSIYLEHTRPGDDLAGTLVITDRMGSQIRKLDFEQPLAPGKVKIMEWDGTDANGNKLPSGLYFIKAEVRSVLYGSKSTRSGKVVLLN